MYGIHVNFERFPTKHATFVTLDHFLGIFHQKNLEKMQNLWKVDDFWRVCLVCCRCEVNKNWDHVQSLDTQLLHTVEGVAEILLVCTGGVHGFDATVKFTLLSWGP